LPAQAEFTKDDHGEMAEDYYKTLGVSRNATQAEIQKAYRDLAKKYHPDMNPDDPSATKKFQEIQAAFDVLSNPEKREMYNQYGESFQTAGAGGPRPGPGGAQWQWQGAPGGQGFQGEFSAEDILRQFMGGRYGEESPDEGGFGDIFSRFSRGKGGRGKGARGGRQRGADVVSELSIPFNTAITGGQVQFTLQRVEGYPETITVTIPPGIEDGKKIRLRGQGQPAPGKGTPGDLLLTIRVAPHPYFSRRGKSLYVRLPVTLAEAALGAKVDVPTPQGTVSLSIPPGSSCGTKLRIKGHGVATKNAEPGDLFAELQIVLPKGLSDADRELIRQLEQRHPMHPRQDLRW
jgi:DnaJ-class molecular chaperone